MVNGGRIEVEQRGVNSSPALKVEHGARPAKIECRPWLEANVAVFARWPGVDV